ncbi:Nucleoside-diphosphate-sugar pyrophosphorylase family protein [alpha proteobacterium HIMB114]|nr:Nucleoside-diphosphate-sugar pyrophosphorylase family protein [alpha proteobacterium HIMB114]
MQIIILNGGKGTRVKSISKKDPKCLIKFKKKPFIIYQYDLLRKKGFKDFVYCLGYKYQKITKTLNKLKSDKVNINYSIEKKMLDTGGALINSRKKLNNIFFVTYGDSYLNINYKKIYNLFKKRECDCVITVVSKSLVSNHEANITIKKNKIISYGKSIKANYIDYGILIFKKKFLFRKKIQKISLNNMVKDLIEKNKICIHRVNKKFYEIGSLHGIKEFKKKINNELL